MKVALVPPYFFPTLEYFQLLYFVDEIIFDDLTLLDSDSRLTQTYILGNKVPTSITYDGTDESILHTLNLLYHHYQEARYFHDTMDIIEACFKVNLRDIYKFNIVSLACILGYLRVDKPLQIYTKTISPDETDTFEQRIEKVMKKYPECALYDISSNKSKYSIDSIHYIQSEHAVYSQFDNSFVEDLSIVDFLFFHHPEEFQTIQSKFKVIV